MDQMVSGDGIGVEINQMANIWFLKISICRNTERQSEGKQFIDQKTRVDTQSTCFPIASIREKTERSKKNNDTIQFLLSILNGIEKPKPSNAVALHEHNR